MKSKTRIIADNLISRNIFSILNSGNGFKNNSEFLMQHGIARSSIDSYLNGWRSPKLRTIMKMAQVLGIDCVDFFKAEEKTEEKTELLAQEHQL